MPYAPILDDLAAQGWSLCRDLLPDSTSRQLAEECGALWQGQDDHFHPARVGTGADRTLRPEIRTDRIRWLDPAHLSPAAGAYWQAVDALRVHLNEAFFLGLRDFEAHFAVYPPGAFYKRHLDQFKASRRRQISCILYLNEGWRPEDGGQLRIYRDGEDEPYVDVLPEVGTFVCFRSDTVYHEVLPAHRDRLSLTGWLCRDA